MAGLSSLAAGVGQVLGRTLFIQTNTSTGIPVPLAVLDVVKEERPEYTAEVSEHPVEQGPEVTDHIQLNNPVLRLKGTISSTPFDISTAVANVLAGGLSAFTTSQARSNLLNSGISQGVGLIGAQLQGNAGDPTAAGTAGAVDAISRAILITAYENRIPFDVFNRRQRYKNMVIKSISFPRDLDTGAALDFEIQLIQVRLVTPLRVTKSQLAENIISGGSSSTSLGSQATQPVNSQILSSLQSSLLPDAPGIASKYPGFLG